ncbi:SHOCT domain-containing protein [Streptomyces sp. NBC_01275]|uniref:SHOCT domain-containing protein n=1 Tax=Streptomyces sp. NBC_01275 TaxID=2903807 RepID=UPI002254A447|nr:SHOCT domain-containing protein [Streptomyces sp. NBC_01275]MCX4767981.1 SHOCT domain-containing protein [Streptomyces sp. NBC_01275]
MLWYGHDPSGWGWFVMSVGMIFFWALLIVIGVLLFRALSRSADSGASTSPAQRGPAAEQLLAERFARGEIDDDEYRRRLTVLRTGGGPQLGKS